MKRVHNSISTQNFPRRGTHAKLSSFSTFRNSSPIGRIIVLETFGKESNHYLTRFLGRSELLPDRFSEKFREIDFPDRSKGIISLGRNLPFPGEGEVKEEGGDREIPGRRGMGSADIPRRGGGCIKLEA